MSRIELGTGQHDIGAFRVDYAPGLRIGGEAGEAVSLLFGGLRGGFAMAAQHGLDARDQLARIERLAEIVVGADLKPDDAVDVLFQRGQKNDGYARALCPQVAAKIEARAVWQHHVEHDEIDLMRGKTLVQLVAICGERHSVPLALDVTGEKLADLGIVVGDEDTLRCSHRSLPRSIRLPAF